MQSTGHVGRSRGTAESRTASDLELNRFRFKRGSSFPRTAGEEHRWASMTSGAEDGGSGGSSSCCSTRGGSIGSARLDNIMVRSKPRRKIRRRSPLPIIKLNYLIRLSLTMFAVPSLLLVLLLLPPHPRHGTKLRKRTTQRRCKQVKSIVTVCIH